MATLLLGFGIGASVPPDSSACEALKLPGGASSILKTGRAVVAGTETGHDLPPEMGRGGSTSRATAQGADPPAQANP